MLVSATEMLKKAKAGHYAVGQFNINNLEWTKSILLTAKELRSPVILGVSEGAGKYMGGYDVVVGMVNGLLRIWTLMFPLLCIWTMALSKAAISVLKQASLPSCLMVLIILSLRT